jgi:hypothetical protein
MLVVVVLKGVLIIRIFDKLVLSNVDEDEGSSGGGSREFT